MKHIAKSRLVSAGVLHLARDLQFFLPYVETTRRRNKNNMKKTLFPNAGQQLIAGLAPWKTVKTILAIFCSGQMLKRGMKISVTKKGKWDLLLSKSSFNMSEEQEEEGRV